MMGHVIKLCLAVGVLLGVVFTTGCVSMSRTDQGFYREIQAAGMDAHAGDTKDPAAAACLNILPGIGNFYLASGTDQGPQVLYGVLNLLTWPLSILWGVPEAAIDAQTINKLETVHYYRFDPLGKKIYAAALEPTEPPRPPVAKVHVVKTADGKYVVASPAPGGDGQSDPAPTKIAE